MRIFFLFLSFAYTLNVHIIIGIISSFRLLIVWDDITYFMLQRSFQGYYITMDHGIAYKILYLWILTGNDRRLNWIEIFIATSFEMAYKHFSSIHWRRYQLIRISRNMFDSEIWGKKLFQNKRNQNKNIVIKSK